MNRGVYVLLAAQFLSAFGDNAILFTAIAMLIDAPKASWYVPVLQSAFLIAFVALAPWVGSFADRHPKSRVLLIGNLLKGAGAGLMLLGVEPILAYGFVGVGAAVYGPAKYGSLPELVGADDLVRANGWIEGSTILAIICGTVVGAKIADYSVTASLAIIVLCYIVSAIATVWLPKIASARETESLGLVHFASLMRQFFVSARARFSMLGASLFWAASAVLRLLLVAWAPAVLALRSASAVAQLSLFLALGVIAGATMVPKFIPIEHLRRARLAAYAMGVCILIFSQTGSLLPARIALVSIGVFGGMFLVPINATLQGIGHHSIGSGGAVALQNFFENLAMLIAVGLHAWAAGNGANPITAIIVVGISVLIATFIVSWHLPADPSRST
jgi:LPLT family lysophospholipid transporter-like MFS transporter